MIGPVRYTHATDGRGNGAGRERTGWAHREAEWWYWCESGMVRNGNGAGHDVRVAMHNECSTCAGRDEEVRVKYMMADASDVVWGNDGLVVHDTVR